MDEYYEALHKCAERYRDMLLDIEYWESSVKNDDLYLFNTQFEFGCRDRLPLMKLNRWLGYIQGCLIERGYTTVETERDWTRPLFRHLDYAEN